MLCRPIPISQLKADLGAIYAPIPITTNGAQKYG